MTLDLALVERSVRRAYEIGRLKRAGTKMAPWGALTALALWIGPFDGLDAAMGALLITTGFVYLWRGQLAEQAYQPGVIAGVAPLVLALLANGPRPHCSHAEGVLSLCTLACAIGGVVAAVRITRFARAAERPPMAFGLAMLPAFLLGSLGCGCIGYAGVITLAATLFLASIPEMVRWTRRAI
jgi:hypothetical protein